ncbi:GHMP kinase [Chytriomyces sp. MP71]|nr:GHMP kinase [Chytriomyces sp. MP71]
MTSTAVSGSHKRKADSQDAPEPSKPAKRSGGALLRRAVAQAPAKLIAFGEHAVVYPGVRAVASALALHTRVAVSEVQGCPCLNACRCVLALAMPSVGLDRLSIPLALLRSVTGTYSVDSIAHDAELVAKVNSALDQLECGPVPPMARKAVVALLVLYIGISDRVPLTIDVTSQIPPGSGLGSSASFCVGLAASLLLHSGKISAVSEAAEARAQQQKDLDLINAWGYAGETVLHGTVSGVDNTVVCFGKVSFVVPVEELLTVSGGANIYVKGQPLNPIKGFPTLRMLLTNTRVEKDTKKQVAIVTKRMKDIRPVSEKLVSAIDSIAGECSSLFEQYARKEVDSSGVCDRLETLIQMNHGILNALGVSHPTLERVVNITTSHGLATKLTGAGGGGCALTLIREDTKESLLSTVVKELEAAGFECFESLVGCGGVTACFQ